MQLLLRHLSESSYNINITKIFFLKIISIILLLLISISFGFMPFFIQFCRKSNKFLSLSNSFSAGIFLGLGFFHILPEAAEILHKKTEFPLAYVCCFLSYSLNLFIEKVAFSNSHNILHHGHHEHNENNKENNNKSINLDSNENKEEKELVLDIKVNQLQTLESNTSSNKKSSRKCSDDINIKTSTPYKTSFISYLLLFALGFHGLFEGISLGIQKSINGALFLFIAIILHKWAASLTLGISFVKSQVSKREFIIMILIFSFITPLGITIGMILTSVTNDFIAGIFLSISVGTFIYIACSEVIIDEFSKKENIGFKFLCFLLGGGLVLGLNLLELFSGNEHTHKN